MSGADGSSDESVAPLRFDVRYRLGEYVAFAVADARATDVFVRDAARWKQWIFAGVLGLFATATFVWKSLRVGRCAFIIDAHRIERTSRRGVSGVPWTRVRAVRIYRRGYLVELAQGAVPIPFRVLTQDAQCMFERLAGPLLQSGQDCAINPRPVPARSR